ncbi:MAG: glycosyltransferase family 4 protein [Opitutales bacterium]
MSAAAAARTGPWADVLSERGHEVSILSSRQAMSEADSRVQVSRFDVPSIQASLPRRLLQEIRLGRDLGRLLSRLDPQPELTIITSPPFFMACLCAKTLRRLNLPYVLDVRDRYPDVLFDLDLVSQNGLLGKHLKRMERNAYSGARLVTTVTRGLTKDLGEVAGKEKVALFPNGFDGKVFTKETLHRPKREQFTVVYHGRLGRFYDVAALQALISETERLDANVRFLFVGDLGSVARKGNWGRSKFLGEMSLSRIANLLAECHLGACILKKTDAMSKAVPAKVYEYLGAGLPVLAAPDGELSDFLSEREVGLTFSHAEPEAMAKAIVSLKNDSEKWERMAANARALRPSLDRREGGIRFVERLEQLCGTPVMKKVN